MRENNLERFIKAQESEFKTALAEIKSGHKRSCWMWYIFPQIQGLGSSGTAMYYAIEDYEEAKAYIENAVTNAHLRESSEALLQLESDDATRVMGWPDDLKLRSSMTLFALAAKENEVFRRVLDKFFDGKLDAQTVDILDMRYLVMRIDEPDFGCEGRPDGERDCLLCDQKECGRGMHDVTDGRYTGDQISCGAFCGREKEQSGSFYF